MKNYIVTQGPPTLRLPVHVLPPLHGWAIRLMQDVREADYKKGYWMSKWQPDDDGVEFAFEPGLHMAFSDEADARTAVKYLREGMKIEAEVVHVG